MSRRGNKLPMMIVRGIALLSMITMIEPSLAILNCLTPNMYKMGKGGQPLAIAGGLEQQVNWPGQQQAYGAFPGRQGAFGFGLNPMKALFPQKWNNWGNSGTSGPNYSNLMRPQAYGGYQSTQPIVAPSASGYPINEQLNVAPISVPPSIANNYPTQGGSWSAPLSYSQALQQNLPTEGYNGASDQNLRPQQPANQQSGIKGGGGQNNQNQSNGSNNNRFASTTKRPRL